MNVLLEIIKVGGVTIVGAFIFAVGVYCGRDYQENINKTEENK